MNHDLTSTALPSSIMPADAKLGLSFRLSLLEDADFVTEALDVDNLVLTASIKVLKIVDWTGDVWIRTVVGLDDHATYVQVQ